MYINKEKINNDITSFYIKQLNSINNQILLIKEEIEKYLNLITDYINAVPKIINHKEIIKHVIKKLSKIITDNDETKYEKILSSERKRLKDYYDLTSSLYMNNHIQKIKEYNDNLYNYLNGLYFIPPSINNFAESSIDLLSSSQFYQGFALSEKKDTKKKSDVIVCPVCNDNESTCFCETCNHLFCNSCLEKDRKKKKFHIHNLTYISDIKSKNEKLKTLFLKSIKIIIENILISANYILNEEKKKLVNLNNNNDNLEIQYIKKIINYPYIKKFKDFNSQMDFLKEINSMQQKENVQNNINFDSSFHISEMKKELILTIKDIFIDENINLFDGALSDIDNNFYSDDDTIIDEKNERFKENKNDVIKNNFYCSIDLIPKSENILYNIQNLKENAINEIKEIFLNNKENIFISFNNKSYFIDNFIRTKEFLDSSFEKIKTEYENLYQLFEYKMIINSFFYNQCDIGEYLDYRGNFYIPNKNLNIYRGTEKYDPPYGWIGIGLKVLGKYENDNWLNKRDKSSKWAIAYHGVGRINSYNEIINILKNIVIEGLKPGPSQIKCHSMDVRHKGKRVGTGVYLTPSIDIAEEYSGLIQINYRTYKIVLMTRVLIDKIKEPEDFNYWVLNKEYIRVYRILLKEKI